MTEFDSLAFFANALVLALFFVPLFHATRNPIVRWAVLVSFGALLLLLVAPRVLLFYLVYWSGMVLLQRGLGRMPFGQLRFACFWVATALALLPMILWKSFPVTFHDLFNLIGHDLVFVFAPPLGEFDATKSIIIPIGLSFAAFRAVDLLAKTELEMIGREPLANLFAYAFFPSVHLIGPISEYEEVGRALDARRAIAWPDISAGATRILLGLFKLYGLAFWLSDSVQVFTHFDTMSTRAIWFDLFRFAWYFYLNFAGFSDLAIGIGRLFGVRLSENFNWPFFTVNPAEFWNNWHISLTRFTRRYIFVGLGGSRPARQYFAICGTMMVIALWHDFTLSFVVFGLYHSAGLCLHRWLQLRRADQPVGHPAWVVPKIAGTFVYAAASFPLLVIPGPVILPFYASLIGLG